ncbi:acyltransferase [Akkermansiaceae bacterium]|nr:acyltransferase [Akkermansiaceae bacterium]MDA8960505.1 acyltransferase [Akkermansiaceae bacterium]MDB4477959.1 acyltransferase [Akkermansiaceae bacterium]MDB4523059.1 acyltransferase [Akkermansiaceae bacterium]MDB4555644.1 acyltransferase [Akkermansiaceae bacterium]
MMTKHYRPEIDGLRAISVIGVVLFHLELGFPGGFVGVDVFFVISGYLITGILLRQLGEDRFSLMEFWARRVRRIVPAAMVMVVGALLIGAFLQTPERYASLARSAMAHVLMASNCYFTRDQGYFAEKSDHEPLLHTWSLSVEEQFYLIFPLIVCFVWKRAPQRLALVFTSAALISFSWSWIEVVSNPKWAFFLLPARGWELLVGALLAILPQKTMRSLGDEAWAGLGLVLVLAPMFFFDRQTAFPGPGALAPVLGAALLIWTGGSTKIGKLLGWRALVRIGLISYSLYLWHWPFVVFAREMVIELTLTLKISLLVASLLAGFSSWRWVEMPSRSGLLLATRRRSLIFGLTSAVTLFVIAFSIKASGGFPSRLPAELRLIISDITWNGAEYTSAKSEAMPIGFQDDGPVDFVLWGDSHGASAAPAVNAVATDFKLKGHAYLNNGTPPVTGLWFADMSEASAAEMVALNERVLAEIIDSKPMAVFLVGRWVARCEGYNEAEMVGEPGSLRFTTMLVDSMIPEPTFKEASSALARQIKAMGARLAVHGIKLVIFQQVPESNESRTASRFYSMKRFSGTSKVAQFTTTKDEFLKRQKRTMKLLENQTTENVTVIDASSQFFFRDRDQLKVYAERSYYRDEDHLTRAGAMHYLEPAFKKFMSWIPREESK